MDVKAAALHALALVLGPATKASLTRADEIMGNTAAEEERETGSLLRRTLFERLGVCNRRSAGALVVELALQPLPEVKCLLSLSGPLTQYLVAASERTPGAAVFSTV